MPVANETKIVSKEINGVGAGQSSERQNGDTILDLDKINGASKRPDSDEDESFDFRQQLAFFKQVATDGLDPTVQSLKHPQEEKPSKIPKRPSILSKSKSAKKYVDTSDKRSLSVEAVILRSQIPVGSGLIRGDSSATVSSEATSRSSECGRDIAEKSVLHKIRAFSNKIKAHSNKNGTSSSESLASGGTTQFCSEQNLYSTDPSGVTKRSSIPLFTKESRNSLPNGGIIDEYGGNRVENGNSGNNGKKMTNGKATSFCENARVLHNEHFTKKTGQNATSTTPGKGGPMSHYNQTSGNRVEYEPDGASSLPNGSAKYSLNSSKIPTKNTNVGHNSVTSSVTDWNDIFHYHNTKEASDTCSNFCQSILANNLSSGVKRHTSNLSSTGNIVGLAHSTRRASAPFGEGSKGPGSNLLTTKCPSERGSIPPPPSTNSSITMTHCNEEYNSKTLTEYISGIYESAPRSIGVQKSIKTHFVNKSASKTTKTVKTIPASDNIGNNPKMSDLYSAAGENRNFQSDNSIFSYNKTDISSKINQNNTVIKNDVDASNGNTDGFEYFETPQAAAHRDHQTSKSQLNPNIYTSDIITPAMAHKRSPVGTVSQFAELKTLTGDNGSARDELATLPGEANAPQISRESGHYATVKPIETTDKRVPLATSEDIDTAKTCSGVYTEFMKLQNTDSRERCAKLNSKSSNLAPSAQPPLSRMEIENNYYLSKALNRSDSGADRPPVNETENLDERLLNSNVSNEKVHHSNDYSIYNNGDGKPYVPDARGLIPIPIDYYDVPLLVRNSGIGNKYYPKIEGAKRDHSTPPNFPNLTEHPTTQEGTDNIYEKVPQDSISSSPRKFLSGLAKMQKGAKRDLDSSEGNSLVQSETNTKPIFAEQKASVSPESVHRRNVHGPGLEVIQNGVQKQQTLVTSEKHPEKSVEVSKTYYGIDGDVVGLDETAFRQRILSQNRLRSASANAETLEPPPNLASQLQAKISSERKDDSNDDPENKIAIERARRSVIKEQTVKSIRKDASSWRQQEAHRNQVKHRYPEPLVNGYSQQQTHQHTKEQVSTNEEDIRTHSQQPQVKDTNQQQTTELSHDELNHNQSQHHHGQQDRFRSYHGRMFQKAAHPISRTPVYVKRQQQQQQQRQQYHQDQQQARRKIQETNGSPTNEDQKRGQLQQHLSQSQKSNSLSNLLANGPDSSKVSTVNAMRSDFENLHTTSDHRRGSLVSLLRCYFESQAFHDDEGQHQNSVLPRGKVDSSETQRIRSSWQSREERTLERQSLIATKGWRSAEVLSRHLIPAPGRHDYTAIQKEASTDNPQHRCDSAAGLVNNAPSASPSLIDCDRSNDRRGSKQSSDSLLAYERGSALSSSTIVTATSPKPWRSTTPQGYSRLPAGHPQWYNKQSIRSAVSYESIGNSYRTKNILKEKFEQDTVPGDASVRDSGRKSRSHQRRFVGKLDRQRICWPPSEGLDQRAASLPPIRAAALVADQTAAEQPRDGSLVNSEQPPMPTISSSTDYPTRARAILPSYHKSSDHLSVPQYVEKADAPRGKSISKLTESTRNVSPKSGDSTSSGHYSNSSLQSEQERELLLRFLQDKSNLLENMGVTIPHFLRHKMERLSKSSPVRVELVELPHTPEDLGQGQIDGSGNQKIFAKSKCSGPSVGKLRKKRNRSTVSRAESSSRDSVESLSNKSRSVSCDRLSSSSDHLSPPTRATTLSAQILHQILNPQKAGQIHELSKNTGNVPEHEHNGNWAENNHEDPSDSVLDVNVWAVREQFEHAASFSGSPCGRSGSVEPRAAMNPTILVRSPHRSQSRSRLAREIEEAKQRENELRQWRTNQGMPSLDDYLGRWRHSQGVERSASNDPIVSNSRRSRRRGSGSGLLIDPCGAREQEKGGIYDNQAINPSTILYNSQLDEDIGLSNTVEKSRSPSMTQLVKYPLHIEASTKDNSEDWQAPNNYDTMIELDHRIFSPKSKSKPHRRQSDDLGSHPKSPMASAITKLPREAYERFLKSYEAAGVTTNGVGGGNGLADPSGIYAGGGIRGAMHDVLVLPGGQFKKRDTYVPVETRIEQEVQELKRREEELRQQRRMVNGENGSNDPEDLSSNEASIPSYNELYDLTVRSNSLEYLKEHQPVVQRLRNCENKTLE